MFRSAAKRLLHFPAAYSAAGSHFRRTTPIQNLTLPILKDSAHFSTSATTESPHNPIPNPFTASTESTTTSTTSSGSAEEGKSRDRGGRSARKTQPRAHYQDEQVIVLDASLRHVSRLGWTEAAMMAGARDIGVSPSIVGSFPRKEAALVEHFMDECLEKLMDVVDTNEDLSSLIPSERIAKLVRIRLEMQAPYISKWPQALTIQAQPPNIPNSFKQRAMLVDEIWHAAGDETNDFDWYVKRTILGGIYSTTEIYMLTDSSPDFRDTWAFLNGRIRDAFDLKKSFQEATYLAEAIGAGMGSSVQGFMKTVFKN